VVKITGRKAEVTNARLLGAGKREEEKGVAVVAFAFHNEERGRRLKADSANQQNKQSRKQKEKNEIRQGSSNPMRNPREGSKKGRRVARLRLSGWEGKRKRGGRSNDSR